MKAKKPAAKPAKKAAKPMAKKAVAKKPVAKKPVAKPKPAPKPVAKKAKPSKVLAAASSKLKSLFGGSKKPAPAVAKPKLAAKSAAKPVSKPAAKPAATPAKSAVVAKPAAKSFVSKVPAPKGLLGESQIRRMSDKDYMNDTQLEFFRHRLIQMREEILAREVDVKERLHQREIFADPADRATAEEEYALDLRLRERESFLLRKIDEALRRIVDKEFGYCEKTGDAIGIPRLLARPTATVCVDVKGQDERVEAQFRDR